MTQGPNLDNRYWRIHKKRAGEDTRYWVTHRLSFPRGQRLIVTWILNSGVLLITIDSSQYFTKRSCSKYTIYILFSYNSLLNDESIPYTLQWFKSTVIPLITYLLTHCELQREFTLQMYCQSASVVSMGHSVFWVHVMYNWHRDAHRALLHKIS